MTLVILGGQDIIL